MDSRKNFLIGLGTAALAGCGGGAALVPSNRAPADRLHTAGADIVCAPGVCGGTGPITGLPANLSALTIAEIQAFTAAEVYGLTSGQIGTITPNQLAAFTSTQITNFHGAQGAAWLAAIARATAGATPPPNLVPPPTYTPAAPGSGFWQWWGGAVGTIIGTGITAGATANPIAIFIGGAAGGAIGSSWSQAVLGSGGIATFNFWNTNANDGTGAWNSVDVTVGGDPELDTDGFSVVAEFDPDANLVTISVIPN
jgi:hypothetical protein